MAQIAKQQILSTLLEAHEAEVLGLWLQRLKDDGALHGARIREGELQTQCTRFLRSLRSALAAGSSDPDGAEFTEVRDQLAEISRSRAIQGYSPREIAAFVFSLK